MGEPAEWKMGQRQGSGQRTTAAQNTGELMIACRMRLSSPPRKIGCKARKAVNRGIGSGRPESMGGASEDRDGTTGRCTPYAALHEDHY
jgi:hypothetical protein